MHLQFLSNKKLTPFVSASNFIFGNLILLAQCCYQGDQMILKNRPILGKVAKIVAKK
jgi:hypothetical protein